MARVAQERAANLEKRFTDLVGHVEAAQIEAEAETASEDDVEAEGLQLSFLAGGERRQGATRLRTGLGEDESPGVAESRWQDAMFLVVGLARGACIVLPSVFPLAGFRLRRLRWTLYIYRKLGGTNANEERPRLHDGTGR